MNKRNLAFLTVTIFLIGTSIPYLSNGMSLKSTYQKWGYGQIYNTKILEISAGDSHTVALDSEGFLWTWGIDNYGQLGNGIGQTDRSKPEKLLYDNSGNYLPRFKYVGAGESHSVAIDENGELWSWGVNYAGELGDGTKDLKEAPVKVKNTYNKRMVKVDSMFQNNIALDEDGGVWTWGNNVNGEIGDGSTVVRTEPVKVNLANKIVNVKAGAHHMLVVDTNKQMWIWGRNNEAQIGKGNASITPELTPIKSMSGIEYFDAGYFHTVVVNSNKIWSWGYNAEGQLGNNNINTEVTPIQITKMGNGNQIPEIAGISTGARLTLMLDTDGKVLAFGKNNFGQLGIGVDDLIVKEPTYITKINNQSIYYAGEDLPTIVKMDGGVNHSVFLDIDGNVWETGKGENVGDNQQRDKNSPVSTIFEEIKVASDLTSYPDNMTKIYKPNKANLQSMVFSNLNISLNNIKYIILPLDNNDVFSDENYFNSIYDNTANDKKGILENLDINQTYNITEISDNCRVVVMSSAKAHSGGKEIYAFSEYVYSNFFVETFVTHQGITQDGTLLYTEEKIEGEYGIRLNKDGTGFIEDRYFPFDEIDVIPKEVPYWKLDNTNTEPIRKILDTIEHYKTYIFKYEKDTSNWYDVKFKFASTTKASLFVYDENNNQVDVINSEKFAPKDVKYSLGNEYYEPPKSVNSEFKPVGYIIGDYSDIGNYVSAKFPSGFSDAVIASNNQLVTIIYDNDTYTISEVYEIEGENEGDSNKALPNVA